MYIKKCMQSIFPPKKHCIQVRRISAFEFLFFSLKHLFQFINNLWVICIFYKSRKKIFF